jgi:hypothetical protein
MASTHDLSGLKINTKTAGPLLHLLLALGGEELPSLDPEVSWDVFKRFAGFPTASGNELLSFQAAWLPEDAADGPDPPLFYVTLSREIHDQDESESTFRAVQITWGFSPQGTVLDNVEIWSDQHNTMDEFFEHVEGLPQFRALIASGDLAQIYTVDEDR